MILPAEFESRMRAQLGNEFDQFANALDRESPVSVRLNHQKLQTTLPLKPVAWCSSAYYLEQRPVFSSDPLWHNGSYYVQEASSMMVEAAFLS